METPKTSSQPVAQETSPEVADPTRRRLLKIATYTVPAVIGTLIVSRKAWAGSCAPLKCQPHAKRPPGSKPPRK